MEDKRKNKCKCGNHINGFSDGYGYPANYYNIKDCPKQEPVPKVKGSFWVSCDEKARSRHSFCDGY